MDHKKQRKGLPSWSVLIAIAAIMIVGGAFGFLRSNNPNEASVTKLADNVPFEPVLNAGAPDFTLETAAGESVRLNDFLGQPVLINFWATWCGPCRIEMPAIQDRYESSKSEGLVVLAVNFDESSEAVTAYGAELGLMFPLLLDPGGEIQKRYRNRSYPTSFFVDAEGIIRAHHIGVMTEGQLDENLTKIGIGG